jgi:hypothetical protein
MGCLWNAGVPVSSSRLAEGAAGGNGNRAFGAVEKLKGCKVEKIAVRPRSGREVEGMREGSV